MPEGSRHASRGSCDDNRLEQIRVASDRASIFVDEEKEIMPTTRQRSTAGSLTAVRASTLG
jgi:hypothetical protein